jgi:hypothetical protein
VALEGAGEHEAPRAVHAGDAARTAAGAGVVRKQEREVADDAAIDLDQLRVRDAALRLRDVLPGRGVGERLLE